MSEINKEKTNLFKPTTDLCNVPFDNSGSDFISKSPFEESKEDSIFDKQIKIELILEALKLEEVDVESGLGGSKIPTIFGKKRKDLVEKLFNLVNDL